VRLSRVRIVNHARVPDLDLEVRRHLVLVGTNAVGKTTVIRALNALLAASTSQLHGWFGPDMFRDQAAPLVVEATLTGLDDEDNAWFADDVEVLTTPARPRLQLTIRLTVTLDQIDPELKTVQREFVKAVWPGRSAPTSSPRSAGVTCPLTGPPTANSVAGVPARPGRCSPR
jgi:putative ATP-dependent endonuclease of the OLD family